MSKKTTYICPSCKTTITVYVTLSEPPICNNKHLRGGKVMQEVQESNSEDV